MSRIARNRTGADSGGNLRSKKWVWCVIPMLGLILLGGVWLVGCNREPNSAAVVDVPEAPTLERQSATPEDLVAVISAEIIPEEGIQTSYAISLSLDNTQRFIDYYDASSLTPKQSDTMRSALLPLKAPCCDDNSMATCCCPCNLAKSVWGLSGYLITQKSYGVERVREAASQWLRFIYPKYYIIQEMRNRGVDPAQYGLVHENACYVGNCELPIEDVGCGGMGELT